MTDGTTARLLPCPINGIAGGRFDIVRPRCNVALKLIRLRENEIAEDQQPIDEQKRPESNESPRHGFIVQGQGTCSA